MRKLQFFATGLAVLLGLSYCTQKETPKTETSPSAAAEPTAAKRIKHGEYMVAVGGCNDCHSPKIMTPQGPVPDPARLMSGHPEHEKLPAITDKSMIAPGQWALFNSGLTAAVGPWGISFAANLTPDDTGMGAWSEAQFIKCIREGKSKGLDGTRMLLPPMPWPGIAKMTDEDLKSIFAYLKSLPAVKNVVPNPQPPVI
jgi:hypothetical protein